ncbi:MAG: GspE/PulE family protein [Phycisphaerae bacterium]
MPQLDSVNLAFINPASSFLTLAQQGQPYLLMSWWKPLVLLVPFFVWAWYVSTVLDKHARRFLLPREKFNTIHLVVGLAAVLLSIAMPLYGIGAFLLGLAILVILLAADILIFMSVHNKDERVPEKFRLSLFDFSSMREAKAAKAAASAQGKVELQLQRPDKSMVTTPNAETPEYAVRVAAETLYMRAIAGRGTQLEIAPTGKDNTYRPMWLVDGMPVGGDVMQGADAMKIMDFWKDAAKLDLAERRKKISADVLVIKEDRKRKVRITSLGTAQGMRLQLLFDPEAAVKRDLKELGLLDQQREEIAELVKGKGVVLVAAPADGGRTTTFYTVIRMHDAYTTNVQTMEMEPQGTLEGVRQNKYEQTGDGPEYSTTVRSILRRDPDVLGVAELPDAQTAKEITKADLDRARVYVSVRANSATEALQGWVKLVGDVDAATKQLKGVISQKLLRKLCGNCKQAYQPTPEMVKKLGLPDGSVKQLFKKGGQVMVKDKVQECGACNGVGYMGQEAIFEVITLTDGDRQLLKAGDLAALKLELRKRKVPTLQQSALRKALDGITSVDEVIRVTTDAPATPTAPAAGAAPAAAPKA